MGEVLWTHKRVAITFGQSHWYLKGFPCGLSHKEPACQCRRYERRGFDPWVGKITWRRAQQPNPLFLPGESHGQGSLEGCGPLAAESDTTKQLTHFPVVTSGNYCFYLLGCFSISKERSKEEKNRCGQSRGAVDGSLPSPEHQTDRYTVIPLGVALNRGFKHHS